MSLWRNGHMGCVQTATIQGVEAVPVTVEVSIGQGLPGISIVGMPDIAVQEARLRVRLALLAAGYKVPNVHAVVNLAPSSLRKSGSGFDLPIALGFLVATGQIAPVLVEGRLCVGELSLDGSVRAVKGLLAFEKLAHDSGLVLLTGLVERGVYSVEQQRHACLTSLEDLHDGHFTTPKDRTDKEVTADRDFCEIDGNDLAKRALQIAAAGSHGILLIGPPGSGKSMMAARLPTILPQLSEGERIESAMIHSVAGLPFDALLAGYQPFRAPHHSASRAGILGGGSPPQPGEVSLAHNGVLFLDEMPEFGSVVLQMLRQPIETGTVSLARARGTTVFPARFLLIGAANPCPCGYYGDSQRACRCTPAQIVNYQSRIGGPLMDRFDLVVKVWRSDPSQVLRTGHGTSSASLLDGVLNARAFKALREQKGLAATGMCQEGAAAPTPGVTRECAVAPEWLSSPASGKGMRLIASCGLGGSEQGFLEDAARHYHLSGRGIMRALAVARTIADIEQQEKVSVEHLLEAVTFRADTEEEQ
ncbi:MAG: YifB family Mg chelatase-like AAA ATPase [Coriobacteriales bacterium]|jgi:magnesium chelatase family protein|nr:YifB family Mg chelatase-like AAA ATPase [Coriobacteriales bacterium]